MLDNTLPSEAFRTHLKQQFKINNQKNLIGRLWYETIQEVDVNEITNRIFVELDFAAKKVFSRLKDQIPAYMHDTYSTVLLEEPQLFDLDIEAKLKTMLFSFDASIQEAFQRIVLDEISEQEHALISGIAELRDE